MRILTDHEAILYITYRAQQEMEVGSDVCDGCVKVKPYSRSLYCDDCGHAVAMAALDSRNDGF